MENPYQKIRQSIAGSYSQIFFSDNRVLAGVLLFASFIDPMVGTSGLICVFFSVLIARGIGLNPVFIQNGGYTFNVLLTGMALGAYYEFSLTYVILLAVAALISLLITVAFSSVTTRYNLPFLSLPFIFSIWILFLNLREIHVPDLDSRFLLDKFGGHAAGVEPIDKLGSLLESEYLPEIVSMYFRSMASIFFQHNIIAGIVMAGGLLWFSRISFSLSVIGFFSGYLFFHYIQLPSGNLEYPAIGFNYILSAIALGGFFLVPSWKSYLVVILATPVIAMLSIAIFHLTIPWFLPLYSLPFSVAVILVLIVFHNRYSLRNLNLVQYQLYSPEKNLYAFHTYMERFQKDTLLHIHLPFYGEWFVSQGHSGKITHKDDWRFAWDFVVTDEENKTFRMPGKDLADFYCYSLPVLAPADGTVVTLLDGIEDNAIGDANLKENWGNTIVIHHGENLYSKISHLKESSFKVKEGDKVKKGDLIALCGSSGRSPEPHIHFQIQSTPYIGAKTIEYPVAYFVTKEEEKYKLHSFSHPEEGMVLFPPRPDSLLKNAFHFIPGMEMNFSVEENGEHREENWEVRTDATNNSYICCLRTGSVAYFTNNQTLFYFNSFSGDKDSLLYYFFLGAYKILLAYFNGLELQDNLPVETGQQKLLKPLQDFIAPFHIFMKPVYSTVFESADNIQQPEEIKIASSVQPGKNIADKIDFEILVAGNTISKITVKEKNRCFTAEPV